MPLFVQTLHQSIHTAHPMRANGRLEPTSKLQVSLHTLIFPNFACKEAKQKKERMIQIKEDNEIKQLQEAASQHFSVVHCPLQVKMRKVWGATEA